MMNLGKTRKKSPTDMKILSAMAKDTMENQNLTNIRLISACFFGFSVLMSSTNYDQLLTGKNCWLKIKADKLGKGDEVLIARTGSITCPVAMLEKCFSLGGITLSDGLVLYHGVLKIMYIWVKGEILIGPIEIFT